MTHQGTLALLCLAALAAVAFAQGGDDGGGKQPDGPSQTEYGFDGNRGDPHQYGSEQAKDNFRTRVKWADTKGGYGEHYWEYNHAPKGYGKDEHKGGYKDEHKGYEPPKYEAPSYKAPSYEPPSYEPPSYEPPSYQPPAPSYS